MSCFSWNNTFKKTSSNKRRKGTKTILTDQTQYENFGLTGENQLRQQRQTRRENLQNTQSHQKGGLSGKPIELKSSELIRKFYKVLKGRIKILGVGGVDSGRSAYQKFLAGADYLQLYTGMVFRGPNIVGLIKKELKEILLKDGVKNFNEIVGKKD